jgi:hypothetical protein
MALSFVCAVVLSITSLIMSYQQHTARAFVHGGCFNIPATPNYLDTDRADDAIAAINHARFFERLPPLRLPNNFYQLDAARQQFVLVNLERTDRGLRPLMMNSVLATMARGYSAQLSRLHFFSHTSPISGTFGQRINSNPAIARRYALAEENLAGNPVAGIGPIYEYMYNDVDEGCGHRLNILEPSVTLIGIGVVEDSTYGSISAQEMLALLPGVSSLP